MKPKILQQGAEAIITLEKNNQVLKNRISKSYRLKELDNKLRTRRTKSEAKIISKLQNIIPVPKILETDDKEKITMQYIQGKKLSQYLEQLDYKKICKQIAENITKMHNQDIIHGDLTTSNMIYAEGNNNLQNKSESNNERKGSQGSNNLSVTNNNAKQPDKVGCEAKVFLIDFGLSFHSHKIEDKAVDLHLIQQALEAKHFTIWKDCWDIILKNYKAHQSKLILEQLKKVESRGRYKDKN